VHNPRRVDFTNYGETRHRTGIARLMEQVSGNETGSVRREGVWSKLTPDPFFMRAWDRADGGRDLFIARRVSEGAASNELPRRSRVGL